MAKQYFAVLVAGKWQRSPKVETAEDAWTATFTNDFEWPGEEALGEIVRPAGRSREKADEAIKGFQATTDAVRSKHRVAKADPEGRIITRLREMVAEHEKAVAQFAAELAKAGRAAVWVLERHSAGLIAAEEMVNRARPILAGAAKGHNPIKLAAEAHAEAVDHLMRNHYRHNSTSVLHNAISDMRREGVCRFANDWCVRFAPAEHAHRNEARAELGLDPIDLDAWWGEAEECHRCHQPLADPMQAKWLELNSSTGEWVRPHDRIPEEDSQGSFPFGADCAKVVLSGEDKNYPIYDAKRRR